MGLFRSYFKFLQLCSIRSFATTSTAQYAPRHQSIKLRPYQERAIQACLDAKKEGRTRCGVSLPTGSGKSVVIIHLLSRIGPHSLIIVNNVLLAKQMFELARRLLPGWKIELEQAHNHASGEADLTVATYHSLSQPRRLSRYDAKSLNAIIVDEAHHAVAPEIRFILSHFHPDIEPPEEHSKPAERPGHAVPIFGFSATFSSMSKVGLWVVFPEVVYHRNVVDMIEDGYLCDVKVISMKTRLGLRDVPVYEDNQDFGDGFLAVKVNTRPLNSLIYHCWREKADLDHVRHLTYTFKLYGVPARFIYSGTTPEQRETVLEEFRSGAVKVLINCRVLTEGADFPFIDCVIVARPTRSKGHLTQMIGRGLRLSPETGKRDCLVLDMFDACDSFHDSGLVTVPCLQGDEPPKAALVSTTRPVYKGTRRKPPVNMNDEPRYGICEPAPAEYVSESNPFLLFSGIRHLRKITENAWVRCKDESYVLRFAPDKFIRVKRMKNSNAGESSQFWRGVCSVTDHLSRLSSDLQETRHIVDAPNLYKAIRKCDKYVQDAAFSPLRTDEWRAEPVTAEQEKAIKQPVVWAAMRELLSNEDAEIAENPDLLLARCSNGQAFDLLTRITYAEIETGTGSKSKSESKTETETETEVEAEAEDDDEDIDVDGLRPYI